MSQQKPSFGRRAVRKAARVWNAEAMERIAALEAEVQETRQLNVRVAELVDLLQELMVPLASQDREKIEAALAKYEQSL